jgi:hypothetical protein
VWGYAVATFAAGAPGGGGGAWRVAVGPLAALMAATYAAHVEMAPHSARRSPRGGPKRSAAQPASGAASSGSLGSGGGGGGARLRPVARLPRSTD